MSNFVVSARKYRPSTFDMVVGQNSITTTLKNAIKNKHLAQAFLFCGPRGVGKTTCARILAKTINCSNITSEMEACNTCESCQSFNNGQSLNIYELDAASNNSVDDIRSLVEQVRYAPHQGQFKIYIIDEVHMLSAGAFNAFLKTLEEPPPYAIFILATTEKHKIIPTILSRCQIFDFNRIGIEDIAHHLKWISEKENVKAEEDALHIIAQKADGALRDALSIFDQIVSFAGNTVTYKDVINNLNILDYDYYFKITDEILQYNISAALLTFNELLHEGFDGHHFITGLSGHFRDLLVCRDEVTLQLLEVSKGIREKYKLQSRSIDTVLLMSLLEIGNRCDIEYRGARNQRLHVELALLKMCSTVNSFSNPGTPSAPAAANPLPKTSGVATEKKNTVVKEEAGTPAAVVKTPVEKVIIASENKATYNPPAKTNNTPATTASPRIPSISAAMKPNSIVEKKETPPETGTEKKTPDQNIEVAEEDIQSAWDQFAVLMKEKGKISLSVSLTKRKPVLINKNTIEFEVENTVQDGEVKEAKVDLIGFLKEKLRGASFQIETKLIDISDEPKKAYTPKEKFKKMLEKNPDLGTLQQRFDLELDF